MFYFSRNHKTSLILIQIEENWVLWFKLVANRIYFSAPFSRLWSLKTIVVCYLSLSFDHFARFTKYPYQKQLLINIFKYPFASFTFLLSKPIQLCSVTIILATVHLATNFAFCSVRIVAIIIGCINCTVC